MRIPVLRTKMIVVPDATTPGSEGRLCLQLPVPTGEVLAELSPDWWQGMTWRPVGNLGRDQWMMLVNDPEGKVVSPRSQIWWKNGVREYGIRQNHWCCLYILNPSELIVVRLLETTDDIPPVLPPHQPTIFGR